ncbi:MAG: hypothetical protein M5U16_12300 [Hyphomicrobium sp.]|nr:hypothetical protein [Hyphomicrobium sp.]
MALSIAGWLVGQARYRMSVLSDAAAVSWRPKTFALVRLQGEASNLRCGRAIPRHRHRHHPHHRGGLLACL